MKIDAFVFKMPEGYINWNLIPCEDWPYRLYFVSPELLKFAKGVHLVFKTEKLWGVEFYVYISPLNDPKGAIGKMVEGGFNIVDISEMTKEDVCKNPELFRLVLNGIINEKMVKQ